MDIALLHTPYYYQEHMENLPFVANNFGTLPPIGLMHVSSILQENGHETDIIDVKAEGLSRDDVINKLKNFDPDLIGFMVIPYTVKITLDWIQYVKEMIDVPVLVGNYAMLHYPEAIVSREYVDYGIIGSARESLPILVDHIENGGKGLGEVEGLAFCNSGEIVTNYPEGKTEDLKKLPRPDRKSIDNSNYFSMASNNRPFTILTTSYGCTYDCSFCDMGDFGYSEKSVKDVLDEIEHCVEDLGIKEIDIFDRDFLIKRGRAMEICEGIIERGLDFKWSCRARVDEVDDKLLELMNRAGCRLILYGIESGSQEILDRDHKGINLEEIEEGLRLTKEAGIETLGFFIIGHEGETEKQARKTIEFSKELPLDYAQFFKMTAKPGTKLYEDVVEELGYDYFEELIKGNVDESDLPRPWTDLSNEEIEGLVWEAYQEFYLRPGYIIKRLVNIDSLSELKKYVKAGIKILSKKFEGLFAP